MSLQQLQQAVLAQHHGEKVDMSGRGWYPDGVVGFISEVLTPLSVAKNLNIEELIFSANVYLPWLVFEHKSDFNDLTDLYVLHLACCLIVTILCDFPFF